MSPGLPVVVSLLLPVLASCAVFPTPTRSGIGEDGQLYYRGPLTADANETIKALYESAGREPRVLRITSGGGDVYLGMDLGEWVNAHGLDVHVVKGCASSCANYVFSAGRKKLLDPDSVLFWHGGAYQAGLEDEAGERKLNLQEWREREDSFYLRIGVDGRITTCGQAAQLELNKSRDNPYVGFDYSVDDLRHFGIDDVVLTEDSWAWREHSPANKVLRVDVVRAGPILLCEPNVDREQEAAVSARNL